MKTLKTTFLLAGLALLGSAFVWKAHLSGSYDINTEKSSLLWVGKKVGGTHMGTIAVSEGSIEMAHGRLVSGKVVIDMNSLLCTDIKDEEKATELAKHLKDKDFFHVSKFETATFTIKSLTPAPADAAAAGNYIAAGDLTIKDITNPISFPVEFGVSETDFAAKGTITFDRTKWGVNYGSSLGNAMINDKIELTFGIVGAKSGVKAE